MAEYNGWISGHIRTNGRDRRLRGNSPGPANASAKDPVMYGDIAVPNPLITNMAKLHFASKYHEIMKLVQDICGGSSPPPRTKRTGQPRHP